MYDAYLVTEEAHTLESTGNDDRELCVLASRLRQHLLDHGHLVGENEREPTIGALIAVDDQTLGRILADSLAQSESLLDGLQRDVDIDLSLVVL